jgi:ferredoxin-NADP reductase
VVADRWETSSARTLLLDVDGRAGHRAGQHVDLRLTADDGYSTQRSYSLASPPGAAPQLTVQRLDDGEVSPYLVDEVRTGDVLELRGPVGGYFVWPTSAKDSSPTQLVAGGSGLVPLMAMARHHAASGSATSMRVLVSARDPDRLLYREALARLARTDTRLRVDLVFSRRTPEGWPSTAGRVDAGRLRELTLPPAADPQVLICGTTGFVELVADHLVALGHPPGRIRTERFG